MSRAIWQFVESPEGVRVLDDPATLKAFSDPRRQRILRSLSSPASAGELAQRLGEPASRLYYHLRLLEDHGLIVPVGERQVRSNREVIYGLAVGRFEAELDDETAAALGAGAKAFSLAAKRFVASETEPVRHKIRIVDWSTMDLTVSAAKEFRKRYLSLVEETRQQARGSERSGQRVSVFHAVFSDDKTPA